MSMSVEIDGDERVFAPGAAIRGTVRWQLEEEPKRLELTLAWFTDGKGDRDVGEAGKQRWEYPGRGGEHPFHFELPAGPWSFSGRLITLSWALEIVAYPSKELARAEFAISPTGAEIRLGDPA